MPWIDTATLVPYQHDGERWLPAPMPELSYLENLQVYNGLDTCITYEVLQALRQELDPDTEVIYKFERAMQGPAFSMMTRGIEVDTPTRANMIADLEREQAFLEERLNRLAFEVWGKPLNARSSTQLKTFFYDVMRLPEIGKVVKGEFVISLDRKTLEKLDAYLYARPFVSHILAIRERTKSLGTLRSAVDADSRMRTSYSGSTETGRWTSSENAFGTGTNLQNITERLRRIFVAGTGYRFAYIDLEQAESRAVALLTYLALKQIERECLARGEEPPAWCAMADAYLSACESEDLHTTVCMMCWPELDWTEDILANKRLASSLVFYREFTYRDIAKRLGHGSNYRGTPFGMSQIIPVEQSTIAAFQSRYFKAFPLEYWHAEVIRELQTTGMLVTPLRRRRHFFGRLRDDATIREAIAYQPQSMVGDMLNLGMYKVWAAYRHDEDVNLAAQIHDAILLEYPEERENEVVRHAQELISVPLTVEGKTLIIPSDAAVGWNFSKRDDKKKLFPDGNPDGLIGFTGNDERRRSKAPSLLDRRLR